MSWRLNLSGRLEALELAAPTSINAPVDEISETMQRTLDVEVSETMRPGALTARLIAQRLSELTRFPAIRPDRLPKPTGSLFIRGMKTTRVPPFLLDRR